MSTLELKLSLIEQLTKIDDEQLLNQKADQPAYRKEDGEISGTNDG